jgi:potassium efflux system protein
MSRHASATGRASPSGRRIPSEDFGADAQIFCLNYWLELAPGVVSRIIASDLRFMIEKSFSDHAISIAYPQRDVHLDTSGPLAVRLVETSASIAAAV